MCDGKWSRSRYAVILVVVGGCLLGAGPWRCSLLPSPDALLIVDRAPGPGPGSGSHGTPDSDAGPDPRGAGRLPAPPTPPPPVPPPGKPAAPPTAPPIATAPRRDEPTTREPHAPAKPPASPPRALVPDEVIMTAIRALHPTFVACWKRAQRNDPALVSARIRLSLELDDAGAVTASRTDAEDPKLSRCLAGVARKLTFPALGRPAAFEIPLYF